MVRFRWLLILLVGISLLGGSGWLYRVHLIQSSLPYLLKDILTQAGIEFFEFELKDISVEAASLKYLSFEIDTVDSQNVKQTVNISLHNIELQYQYQSLLKGRLAKVQVERIALVDTTEKSLSNTSSINSNEKQALAMSNQNKPPLSIVKENINKFRYEWRSLIPVDALTVDEIVFRGDLFGALENYQFGLVFDASDDTMDVDILGEKDNVHAVKISSHVKDEWLFSIAQSETATLVLRLSDESIIANYMFNAEKLKQFLEENKIENINSLNLSGTFNGEINVYYENSLSPDSKISSFSVKAKKAALTGDTFETVYVSDIDMKMLFKYQWLAANKKMHILQNSYMGFSQLRYESSELINTPFLFDGILQIKPDSWFYEGELSIDSLTAKSQKAEQTQAVSLKNITSKVIANNQRLKFSGQLQPAVVPATIAYRLDYKTLTAEGSLQVFTDEPLNLSNEKSISQLLKLWPYSFDVFNGEVDFDANVKWNKIDDMQLITHLSLKNVGGVFNELVFSGLNTSQNLTLFPMIETVNDSGKPRVGQTGLIKLDFIDSGVLISDLSFQLALHQSSQDAVPVFDVYNFNAKLLGGDFSAQKFTLNFNQPVNHLLVQVSHLDLSRVAKIHKFSGLDIEGLLDGKLPIELTEEGAFIYEGQFYNAHRKGIIRYQPEASVKQVAANPLSAIALKALRDFRYDRLNAKLSYVPEGDLTIGLEMNGLSPELDNGRQVNLNINTEQNLKSLLKSMRFSQGLSDSIDHRVRQKYSATQ